MSARRGKVSRPGADARAAAVNQLRFQADRGKPTRRGGLNKKTPIQINRLGWVRLRLY